MRKTIDTHTHIYDKQFENDFDDVLKKLYRNLETDLIDEYLL